MSHWVYGWTWETLKVVLKRDPTKEEFDEACKVGREHYPNVERSMRKLFEKIEVEP